MLPHPAMIAGPWGFVWLSKQATQTGCTVSSNSKSRPNFMKNKIKNITKINNNLLKNIIY
jgi:hypothetical protein